MDGTGNRPERSMPQMLFVQRAADHSGSTISGQLTVEGMLGNGWRVDVVFGHEGDYIGKYPTDVATTRVIPHDNWLRRAHALRSAKDVLAECYGARRFVEVIREVKPDVVYINSLPSLAAAVAARRMGIPVVWHIRELFDDVGGEMVVSKAGGKSVARLFLRTLADRVITVSSAVAKNILGRVDRQRTSVVPNAAPDALMRSTLSRADGRDMLGLPHDRLIVGIPGMLRPMKGHAFLLESAARVVERHPECLFVATGTGEPSHTAKLDERIRVLGLSEHVRLVGIVEDMVAFYRACDLLCVPSRSDPCPRTVVESMASGTPLVATAVGGIPELVRSRENAELVEYGDVDALASAIRRCLERPDDAAAMAQRARELARKEYSREAYQDRIRGIVEGVLR